MALYSNVAGTNKLLAQTSAEAAGGGIIYSYSSISTNSATFTIPSEYNIFNLKAVVESNGSTLTIGMGSGTTVYFNRIDFTNGSNNISVSTSSYTNGFTTDYLSSNELSYIVDLILTKESNGYYNVNGSINAVELQYNIHFSARDTGIQLYRGSSGNGNISLFVLGFK